MENPFDFNGKAAIITGGTKGIGLALVRAFLGAGADVATCARNQPDEDIGFNGKRALFVETDVRKAEQLKKLVAKTQESFGRLDFLINNAGGSPPVPAAEASERFNEKILALNLLAPMNLAAAAHPVMMSSGGGVIINISSVSALRPNPYGAAYGAAKAGLINLSETLAAEWGPDIRVLTLTAGLIETQDAELYYGDAEGIQRVGETILMKRMGQPEDIAGVCLFLCSPLAGWMTGANIKVHGGGENPAYLGVSTGTVNKEK